MTRYMVLAAVLALGLAMFAGTVAAQDAAVRQLAPTGTLRVGVAVSPSPSALYVVEDGDGFRGVAIDLGRDLAAKIGVPVKYVPYLASGEITNAADKGVWDVTFMPYDAERAKAVAFGAAYHVLQSTYLVAPGSAITSLAEVNRPGVRIAGIANTATFRASNRASPNATHITLPSVDEAVAWLKAGGADAIALSRESLAGLARELPGARVLDGGFLNSVTAVAVPKGRPAALELVNGFVEEAKKSGSVRRSFDAIGLTSSMVAAPGMKGE